MGASSIRVVFTRHSMEISIECEGDQDSADNTILARVAHSSIQEVIEEISSGSTDSVSRELFTQLANVVQPASPPSATELALRNQLRQAQKREMSALAAKMAAENRSVQDKSAVNELSRVLGKFVPQRGPTLEPGWADAADTSGF